jgi:hypothetical protein
MFASSVVPLRLPARYYATRSFEKAGRVYDLLGVRWYRRAMRPFLWSVNPALLRSRPAAGETMIEHTKDAETGHETASCPVECEAPECGLKRKDALSAQP